MDYHAQNRSKDGVIQIPIYGFVSRNIDDKWPSFKEEPCNVRLSLAPNGVNPFGDLRSIYLVWPIFVINNIIPPWMSIKSEHTMLAMIVPSICLQYLFNVTTYDHLYSFHCIIFFYFFIY